MTKENYRRINEAVNAIRTEEDLQRVLLLLREISSHEPEAWDYAEAAVMHAGCFVGGSVRRRDAGSE
jgi:hypothetical protein